MKRLIASFAFGLVLLGFVSLAGAQSLTTGAISGTVVDQSGAVMASVVVTAKNVDTGATRETQTTGSGNFLLAQLDPGRYEVTAESAGFVKTKIGSITVAVSRVASLEFHLKVGAATATVEVKQEAPLIEPDNPNTTTTLNASQLADLPNPGNDLSYVGSLAPGAVLNTNFAGGFTHGNFEVNGLGSVSTDFSIDGLNANDPFNNVNLIGASGLQLGLNAVREVSINTESYATDQGRLGAAQVNYVTKSGTNEFHGNAWELWNGSALNARNFFLNALGVQRKPRSNVNQFGASVGGPILRGKLFFFADVEGIRIVLSSIQQSTLPTPAYQAYVLQQLPLGGNDTALPFPPFSPLPPEPAEVPLYQNMFKLMGDTSGGVPLAVLGCPFDVGGGNPAVPNDGNGCANVRKFSVSPPANETLFTTKFDYNLGTRDSFWLRFQLNNGQRRQIDPVNSVFDTVTSVPIRSGSAGWTHTFSPNLVNQFNPGFSYTSNNPRVANPVQALPITYLVPPFNSIGGQQSFLPFGVATTVWQLNDNLSWNRGRQTFTFGENFRRLLFTSFNGIEVIPFEIGFSLPEFTFGAAANSLQSFTKSVEDRLAQAGLDTYASDTIRATAKLTVSVGVRAAWNSAPVSEHSLFSRLKGSFGSLSHDVSRPLNQDILASQGDLYASTPLLQWQPRVAVTYQENPRTVLRAGFGLFADPYQGNLDRILAVNPPSYNTFTAGISSSLGGIAIAPGVPNSAVDKAIAANQKFNAGFANGVLSCASPSASPSNCLPAINFTDFTPNQDGQQQYPYIMQWSAGIEHQFTTNFAVIAKYVGTRAVKLIYGAELNAFQTVCQGCFAPVPFGRPVDPRFSDFFGFQTGANSSYHGLQLTAMKRLSHGLSFLTSYAYSHCNDTMSNGGVEGFNANAKLNLGPFGDLGRFRGDCDYDIRHSLNGSYIYNLPFHSKNNWLDHAIGGWQVSGTFFVRGGFPFSVLSALPPGGFQNSNPTVFPNPIPGVDPYSKSAIPGVTQPGTIQWLNPNAFQSVWDSATRSCFPTTSAQNCQDGSLGRNTLRAPGFRWTDFSVSKGFKISERMTFRFDTQVYNLFNHPNFGFPGSFGRVTAGIPGQVSTLRGFGAISTTVSPNTGLLGAGLGGDSSVRMIAFRGRIEF